VKTPGGGTGVQAAEFRRLLGRFATGVTVVTARAAGRGDPIGMTASSVASVSLDPPLVLVCVDKSTDMHAALLEGKQFVLNILAADQETVSRRFAEVKSKALHDVPHREGPNGLPVLEGVVAHIECAKQQAVPAGDHTIFLGLVTGGSAVEDGKPLLYHRGGYSTLR
jgi:flavin reductase (DIM6/NTAB) family NADH-FMN oxidoreductase RutF